MEKFNLKIVGTKEYIEKSKKEIKRLHNEGKTAIEIVEIVFTNFPKDIKEVIIKDIELYF